MRVLQEALHPPQRTKSLDFEIEPLRAYAAGFRSKTLSRRHRKAATAPRMVTQSLHGGSALGVTQDTRDDTVNLQLKMPRLSDASVYGPLSLKRAQKFLGASLLQVSSLIKVLLPEPDTAAVKVGV